VRASSSAFVNQSSREMPEAGATTSSSASSPACARTAARRSAAGMEAVATTRSRRGTPSAYPARRPIRTPSSSQASAHSHPRRVRRAHDLSLFRSRLKLRRKSSRLGRAAWRGPSRRCGRTTRGVGRPSCKYGSARRRLGTLRTKGSRVDSLDHHHRHCCVGRPWLLWPGTLL
jgi:hypothetical protein